MKGVLSAYFSDDRTKEAQVKKDFDGFYVELLENGIVKEKRILHGRSLQYAEDCAENFVLGIFDVK